MVNNAEITRDLYYYHKNNNGSITALTNSSGSVLLKYEYDLYGNPYIKTGTGKYTKLSDYKGNLYNNTRLFTSREYDVETNLYYFRARYYSAELGRFISRDPIGQNDDVNLYAYVGNNSVMFVDLMGLSKYVIFVGEDKKGDTLIFDLAYYQYNKLLKQGILQEDILWVNHNNTISEINFQLEKNNHIKEVYFVTHAGSDGFGFGDNIINKEDVGKLYVERDDVCSTTKWTIIGCNAGKGEDSIAQKLSNHLKVEVKAYTDLLSAFKQTDTGRSLSKKLAFKLRDTFNSKIGEPRTDPSKWKIFTPN